jgi:hypothetical protein
VNLRIFLKKIKIFATCRSRRMWDRKRLSPNRDPKAYSKRVMINQPLLYDSSLSATQDTDTGSPRAGAAGVLPSQLAIALTKTVDFFLQTRTFNLCKEEDIRR